MISINLSSVILSQGKDILPFSFWQQRNLDKSASSLKFLFEQSKTLDGQVHGSCTMYSLFDDSHASNHNDLSSVIISLHLYLSKLHYTQLVRRYLNVPGKIHFWGNSALKAIFGTLRMTWIGRNLPSSLNIRDVTLCIFVRFYTNSWCIKLPSIWFDPACISLSFLHIHDLSFNRVEAILCHWVFPYGNKI